MGEDQSAISPLDAVLAIVVTFFLSLLLALPLVWFFGYSLSLILGEIVLIIVPLVIMIFKRVDIASYIGLHINPKSFLLGLAFGAVLFILDVAIVTGLNSVFGVSEVVEETNETLLQISQSPMGLLSVVVALSLAGVCEEFTFRGFLQTAVNSKYSIGVALLVSSTGFALFHFDLQATYTIAAFLMGLMLGYIYYRWRSYVISAVAHATLNLIVITLMVFAG